MAKSDKGTKSGDGAKVKHKKKDKARSGKSKDEATMNGKSPNSSFSLLADEKRVDPALSSLFAAKPTPPTPAPHARPPPPSATRISDEDAAEPDVAAETIAADVELQQSLAAAASEGVSNHAEHEGKRKRKRKSGEEDDVEDAYMRRLAREEAREAEAAANQRANKRSKTLPATDDRGEEGSSDAQAEDDAEAELNGTAPVENADDGEADTSPPPQHETQQSADLELDKAKRTVFLGNVSTSAISSKSSRNILLTHLKSIFESTPKPKDGEAKHAVESIRFRSTPYASALPKKAAFAKKEVMDATAKSTNAYAIYSSPMLAREAVKQLNGRVILERHLRVDSIAHPTPVDHRRCVFVGNLGFVDDESNIQAANEDEKEGKQKSKRNKPPADVEEGLWRTFTTCGKVESVRVIRDSSTRVGKGIAYVQFEDGNAVEAALGLDGKKFPPMLPRDLRVSRAKAVRKNPKAAAGGGRAMTDKPSAATGYRRKVTAEEASKAGRVSKLYGKAAAAKARRPTTRAAGRKPEVNGVEMPSGVKKPEAFVFEGHRARDKGGKVGLKLGRKKGGNAKPTNRSAKRGAAFKASGKKKKGQQ